MEPADRRLQGHAGDPRLGRASFRRASWGACRRSGGHGRPSSCIAGARTPRPATSWRCSPESRASTRWRMPPRAAAPPTTPRACRSPTATCDSAAARCRRRSEAPAPRSCRRPAALPPPAVPSPPARRPPDPRRRRRRRDHRSHAARRYGVPEHGEGRDPGVRGPAPQLRLRFVGRRQAGPPRAADPRPRGAPPGPEGGDHVDRGPLVGAQGGARRSRAPRRSRSSTGSPAGSPAAGPPLRSKAAARASPAG